MSLLEEGWEPIGGLACAGKGLYRQAMIRRDDGIRYRDLEKFGITAPPGIADDMPDQELTFPDHPVLPSMKDLEFNEDE